MSRLVAVVELASLLAGAIPALPSPASADSETLAVRANSHDELNKKWCAASPDVDLILILPASLFVDSQELVCENGTYKLYRIVEHDDPDDFEYYLDPPFGTEKRLGCDGKAGRSMKVVALNCRPE